MDLGSDEALPAFDLVRREYQKMRYWGVAGASSEYWDPKGSEFIRGAHLRAGELGPGSARRVEGCWGAGGVGRVNCTPVLNHS